MNRSEYERIMSRVDTSDGHDACHPWTGTRIKGYGSAYVPSYGSAQLVTRMILGYLRGSPLGPDEMACHHCDNPPCCNSSHLYVGDRSQNMRDMVARGRGGPPLAEANRRKTCCNQGHEFTPENTYTPSSGDRLCRTCRTAAVARYRARKNKAVAK